MNTANFLLKRALERFIDTEDWDLVEEIRAYLDAPKDEPVAYIYEGNGIKTLNFVTDDMKSHLNGDGVSLLFLHPFVQKGVPVAWICEADIDNPISAMVRTQHPCGPCNLPLYLHPPTKTAPMKPMTEEEIKDLFYSGIVFEDNYLAAFTKGVQLAEQHHGIGDGDE